MLALLTAIESRFASASLPTSITGGLWLNMLPPNSVIPYAAVFVADSPTTQLYGSNSFTEPLVDFVVRGVGANASLALAEALRDAFKNQILTLSSGKMVNTVLLGDPIAQGDDPVKNEQGDDTFGWVIPFRFTTT